MLLLIASFILGALLDCIFDTTKIKKILASYLVLIGLPLYIFASLKNANGFSISNITLITIALYLTITITMYYFVNRTKHTNKDKASIYMCGSYGNTGFIGVPVAEALIGPIGAGIAAVVTLVSTVIRNSIGMFYTLRYVRTNAFFALFEVLKMPLFYSCIIAVIAHTMQVPVPTWLTNIASSASYISIFVVGLSLKIKQFHPRHVITPTYKTGYIVKLILVPILFAIFSYGLVQKEFLAMLLLGFTPPAITNTSIAVKYNLNDHYCSEFTSITTIIFLLVCLTITLI